MFGQTNIGARLMAYPQKSETASKQLELLPPLTCHY